MRELFKAIAKLAREGEASVLATVVAGSGSTPRGAGARMLVAKDGRACGTIGGGAVEHRSEQMALAVLRDKCSRFERYMLHKNEIQDLGMICGGEVYVYFRYIPPEESIIALTDKVEKLFKRGEQSWLIEDITPDKGGGMGAFGKDSGLFGIDAPEEILAALQNRPFQAEINGRVFYSERLVRSGVVYIFGGGHVAQALVPVLAAVDFRCFVLEDREDFARKELFPGVFATMLIDNARIADYIKVTSEDYVVVVTRGHKDDQLVQAQMLKTPARYIGVIGSRKKSAAVFANLRVMGFTDDDLARITTPIGLDIGAETPQEIAVSIAAELIKERAGK